jgi:hypothetical protein
LRIESSRFVRSIAELINNALAICKMKYLVFCLIGTAIVLNACSSAPTAAEEDLEKKIHPECTAMKSDLELKRNRLALAAPAEKERMSAELSQADLQFPKLCPIAAKSMKAD